MPIDPSISMGYKGMDMPNPLNQMAQVSQIQASQRQGQAAQMQLDEMKNDRMEMAKLQQEMVAKGGSPDLSKLAQAFIQSSSPTHQKMGIELLQKLQAQSQDRELMGLPPQGAAPTAPTAAPMAPTAAPMRNGALGSGTFGMTPEPAPVNALAPAAAPVAPVNALAPAGADNTAKINQAKAMLLSANPGIREAGKMQLQQLTSQAPDAALMQQLGYPLTQAGYQLFRDAQRQERMLSPQEEAQRVRIAAASRAPAQPRPEQPPVAVVDPVTGKQVFVSREEALRGRMTPAASMESLPPKEVQKREAAFPQATSSMKGFDAKSDSFIKDLEKLRDDPGLNQITGSVFGRTPSLSREGSRAQSQYNKVFAKGGFQALQDMRDASKTGGALGNVSNQEGERLERSIVGGLDRTQNVEDVKAGINELIESIKGSKVRMKEAYDMTYDYKQGKAPAAGREDPLGIR